MYKTGNHFLSLRFLIIPETNIMPGAFNTDLTGKMDYYLCCPPSTTRPPNYLLLKGTHTSLSPPTSPKQILLFKYYITPHLVSYLSLLISPTCLHLCKWNYMLKWLSRQKSRWSFTKHFSLSTIPFAVF